jgi:hypothetical protein
MRAWPLRATLLGVLWGCGPTEPSLCEEDGYYTLIIEAKGFTEREGDGVHLRLLRDGDSFITASGGATVQDGRWSYRGDCMLEEGVDVEVDWFVDYNGDGDCQGEADHVRQADLVAPFEDVHLSDSAGAQEQEEGCAPF